jgi:ubiquinone/menaquinone biosynthesis C-methylase UbiE
MEKADIRGAYARIAPWYDVLELLPELMGIRAMRRRILGRARGRVLEVAAGTGRNIAHYRAHVHLIATDMSLEMLLRARRKARRRRLDAQFVVMDGEMLAVRDQVFDTVLCTLTLCTFADPLKALREMARVCVPDGRMLLFEHGRSSRAAIADWQDRHADQHAQVLGCHWNREPLELVREAGLEVEQSDRNFLGMFHVIEARRRRGQPVAFSE